MRFPRWFHRWYAGTRGYFWLPCPICGRYFGGHEWGGGDPDWPTSIPNLDSEKTVVLSDGESLTYFTEGTGICPWCVRKGNGDRFAITEDGEVVERIKESA
jgi:hypothetical protein